MSLELQREESSNLAQPNALAIDTEDTEHVDDARPALSRRSLLREILEVFLLVLSIYTLVNLATARAIVEGSSMEPNFETGQLVIVNRSAYFFKNPSRGDVIVLHSPRNPTTEDFIKRVIGLPGETVQITKGIVYVNGTRLDEPYIAETNFCSMSCDGTWTLQQDEYFVLGDNRRNSYDGHSFGPIKQSLIVGQAWVRYWPLSEAEIVPHEDYGNVNEQYVAPPATATPIASPTLPAPIGSTIMPSTLRNNDAPSMVKGS